MPRLIVIVIASLVTGLAIGAWFSGDPGKPATSPSVGSAAEHFDQSATLDERLRSLEQVIADERAARLILEDQLQMLIAEIERVDSGGPGVAAARPVEAADAERASERRSRRDFATMMGNYQDKRLRRLVDGGFSEDEARRVLRQESEAQFKAMQAVHDAQRRGESLDPFSTLNGPQSILRAELGDDAYSRYLEAQGQPTAIQITQVLDGSPGSRAGLQPGDQMISYNGERVFSVAELRTLTMQGTPGEDVVVEIDRDGVRMQLSLQRGPVGVTGSGANMRAMNWWGGG